MINSCIYTARNFNNFSLEFIVLLFCIQDLLSIVVVASFGVGNISLWSRDRVVQIVQDILSVSPGGTLWKHIHMHKMWCFQLPSSRASCRSVICLARPDGIRAPLTALIAIATHSKPASYWIDMLDILKMDM